MPFYACSMYVGELCVGLALGDKGIKQMSGDIPVREMQNHHASEFPAGDFSGKEKIHSLMKNYQCTMLLPLLANTSYKTDGMGDIEPFENGVTLQLFIPIGHRRTLQMSEVMLNGEELSPSVTDGYELVCGSDGWHLFLNLPPKRTAGTFIYHVAAKYEIIK